jgi:hypothetical protein
MSAGGKVRTDPIEASTLWCQRISYFHVLTCVAMPVRFHSSELLIKGMKNDGIELRLGGCMSRVIRQPYPIGDRAVGHGI